MNRARELSTKKKNCHSGRPFFWGDPESRFHNKEKPDEIPDSTFFRLKKSKRKLLRNDGSFVCSVIHRAVGIMPAKAGTPFGFSIYFKRGGK